MHSTNLLREARGAHLDGLAAGAGRHEGEKKGWDAARVRAGKLQQGSRWVLREEGPERKMAKRLREAAPWGRAAGLLHIFSFLSPIPGLIRSPPLTSPNDSTKICTY
jgi:hypothetical protein